MTQTRHPKALRKTQQGDCCATREAQYAGEVGWRLCGAGIRRMRLSAGDASGDVPVQLVGRFDSPRTQEVHETTKGEPRRGIWSTGWGPATDIAMDGEMAIGARPRMA